MQEKSKLNHVHAASQPASSQQSDGQQMVR